MAWTQISCKTSLIKINYLYLDLYFCDIKNSDLQIFQKDQLKVVLKCLQRNGLHDINLFIFTTQDTQINVVRLRINTKAHWIRQVCHAVFLL